MSELQTFLRAKKVPDTIIDTLTGQGYDLERFSELTLLFLQMLQFKIADMQLLVPLIEEAKKMVANSEQDTPNPIVICNPVESSALQVDQNRKRAFRFTADEEDSDDGSSSLFSLSSSVSSKRRKTNELRPRNVFSSSIHKSHSSTNSFPVNSKFSSFPGGETSALRWTSNSTDRLPQNTPRSPTSSTVSSSSLLKSHSPTNFFTDNSGLHEFSSSPNGNSTNRLNLTQDTPRSPTSSITMSSRSMRKSHSSTSSFPVLNPSESSQLPDGETCVLRWSSKSTNGLHLPQNTHRSPTSPITTSTRRSSTSNRTSTSFSVPEINQSDQLQPLRLRNVDNSATSSTSNSSLLSSRAVPTGFQIPATNRSTHQTSSLRPQQNAADQSASSSTGRTPQAGQSTYEHLKPELPKFYVSHILKEKMEPKDRTWNIYLKLKNEGFLEDKANRKLVIRILTRHLFSLHPRDPTALTTLEKEGMAKSFILEYPLYAGVHDQDNLPWDHIYCRQKNTGWIANSSRAVQKENRSRLTLKKRKTSDETDENQDPDDPDELGPDAIVRLGTLVPGSSERHDIVLGMKNSFKSREKLRESGTDIPTFLKTFPHLMSYHGEMLRLEFKRMRPDCKDICRTFLPLHQKILGLPLKYPFKLTFEDDTIRALMILSQHLPHDIPNSRDKSVGSTCPKENNLINYISSNEPIDEYVENKRVNSPEGQPIQPYLLAVVSVVTKKVQKYFVVLDDGKTELPASCQSIRAIEHLMAAYFVFQVDYPYGWRNTLHLIATCFLEVFETHTPGQRKDGVTPSERELMLRLQLRNLP